jgi:hypothetical protein
MPNKQHCLAKGGKIVQKKQEDTAPVRVVAWNTETIESLQQRVLSGRHGPYDIHDLVKNILGVGDDGQFYVEVERRRITRQDELLIVEKCPAKATVPARFLKNAGKKNAKIICPDLLKVGTYVSCFTAAGVKTYMRNIGYGGAVEENVTYPEIEYILSAEKEEEWGALGVCQTVSAEIKKLVKENALVPEEKRKPAQLIVQTYARRFQNLQSTSSVAL